LLTSATLGASPVFRGAIIWPTAIAFKPWELVANGKGAPAEATSGSWDAQIYYPPFSAGN